MIFDRKWAKVTQDYALDLWKRGKSVEAGIALQPAIVTSTEETSIPEWTKIAIGLHVFDQKQLKQLSFEHKRNYTYVICLKQNAGFV